MHHFCTPVLAALALCSAVQAQRLAAYIPPVGPGVIAEIQPPVPILPAPAGPLVAYPQVPALPVLPPPAGDSTFNNALGFHWVTNGAALAAQPTPTFPPLGPLPVPAAFAIPGAVLAAIGGGPVTGIALDAAGGILYLTGAPGVTIGCLPFAGMPVVVPPFALLFPVAGPITGLEWDAITGTLIACNAAGVCYTYLPGGAPAAPPIVPAIPIPGPASDVAIDRTLRLNGAGLRPLFVAAGFAAFDVNLPGSPPFPVGAAQVEGLAFLNHPAANPPVGTCLCPGTTYPTQFTTGPMSAGNPAWGIGVGGLPPGWPVFFVFDFAFLPGFPLVNTVGCGLGITALPIIFGAAADPFGNAVLSLAMVPPVLPLGAGPFYNQNITLCATDPALGLVLTPTQVVYVSSL